MSDDILGYDCQGEALRAGDRVEPAQGATRSPSVVGDEFTLSGEIWSGPDGSGRGPVLAFVETDAGGNWCAGYAARLRKINSGRDVFNQARDRALTEGNPDTQRSEPTTTERAQAWISGQPWTEPSR